MNSIRFHNSFHSSYVARHIAVGGVDKAPAQFEARTEPGDVIAALN